ncbi:MAG: protein kinase family protein [Vulcanimicrobiota bacterium]
MEKIAGVEVGQPIGRGGLGVTLLGMAEGLPKAVRMFRPLGPHPLPRPRLGDLPGELGPCQWGRVDHGTYQGCYFLIRPLGVRLQKPEELTSVAIELARALVELHGEGRHHGGLRPSNLLHHEGQWRLADAGLQELLGPSVVNQPRPDRLWYRAPEALDGEGGQPEDVWSLAAVLLELLHGAPPYGRVGEVAWIERARHEPVPRLPHLPAPWSAILPNCLSPRAKRWTAEQMLAYLEGKPVPGLHSQPRRGLGTSFWAAPPVVFPLEERWDCHWDLSPDSRLLALRAPGEIQLVSLYDGARAGMLPAPAGWPGEVRFSPDTRHLIEFRRGRPAHLYNLERGHLVAELEGSEALGKLEFLDDGTVVGLNQEFYRWSPDGQLLERQTLRPADGIIPAVAGTYAWLGEAIEIRPLGGPVSRYRVRSNLRLSALCFDPTGHLVAVGATDLDTDSGHILKVVGDELVPLGSHSRPVNSLALGPGALLASGSEDSTVRIWRLDTGKLVGRLVSSEAVARVAFSFNGQVLVWSHRTGSVRALPGARLTEHLTQPYDPRPKPLRRVQVGPNPHLAFSPTGKTLALASQGHLAVFATTRRDPLFGGSTRQAVTRVVLTDQVLATVSEEGLVAREIPSARVLWHRAGVIDVALAAGCLVALGPDGLLQWLNLAGEVFHSLELGAAGQRVVSSGDGMTLLTLDAQQLRRWRGAGADWKSDYQAKGGTGFELALSPRGSEMVVAEQQQGHWLGRRNQRLSPCESFVFSPKGAFLVASQRRTLAFHDRVDGSVSWPLESDEILSPCSLAAAPGLFAAAWPKGQVQVWHMAGDW